MREKKKYRCLEHTLAKRMFMICRVQKAEVELNVSNDLESSSLQAFKLQSNSALLVSIRYLLIMTFKALGLIDPLLQALEQLGYKTPTDIQLEALPHALEGRDIIGIASTGSGKTAAFALPILQKLWEEPKGLFACVLAPTRELAYQISQQFEALGSAMGVRCAVLIGGMDMPTQQIALAKRPHIVIATPGRLLDHLETTKGFSLRTLKFLV